MKAPNVNNVLKEAGYHFSGKHIPKAKFNKAADQLASEAITRKEFRALVDLWASEVLEKQGMLVAAAESALTSDPDVLLYMSFSKNNSDLRTDRKAKPYKGLKPTTRKWLARSVLSAKKGYKDSDIYATVVSSLEGVEKALEKASSAPRDYDEALIVAKQATSAATWLEDILEEASEYGPVKGALAKKGFLKGMREVVKELKELGRTPDISSKEATLNAISDARDEVKGLLRELNTPTAKTKAVQKALEELNKETERLIRG